MIKIAICDDEKIACETLKNKILSYMDVRTETCEVVCFYSAAGLLETPRSFDLFFLDIQMPDKDGIALARKIREREDESLIIFITVLAEYVYDAFEVEALNYICKPIDDRRLQRTLDRAIRKLQKAESKCLFVKTMNWCKAVKLDDLYYCEVTNRTVHLHTKGGVITYYSKLGDIRKQLDCRFVQCHRSYLVNLDYLLEYSNGQITLECGEHIPVSRLRHQDFMEAIMRYMKGKNT